MAASAASFTRGDDPLVSISEVKATMKPVILTPGLQFGNRAPTPAQATLGSTLFFTLFLPMYCNPPVGLFVPPIDYGYQRFYDLVQGAKPYCAFAKLLEHHADVFC